ncbi:hypothetical protein KAR91_17815 [Candidatus Pacearchaeota archaeon]|nr:hypothetical protein [Candidatus Pacearchaeota archaeon]
MMNNMLTHNNGDLVFNFGFDGIDSKFVPVFGDDISFLDIILESLIDQAMQNQDQKILNNIEQLLDVVVDNKEWMMVNKTFSTANDGSEYYTVTFRLLIMMDLDPCIIYNMP